MLNNLTKKDLEKYFAIHRKFHHASILHGIELLRSLDFDKEEYADKLKETGVHGALIVMEPSFTAETLATALGIPPSKSYVRRHLVSELEALIKPAREELEITGLKRKSGGGSLGRTFTRSFRSTTSIDDLTPKPRMSIRGSLGKAFSRKSKHFESKDNNSIDTPVSIKQKIMDPVATQQNQSSPLDFSSTAV
uniref:SAM domain-containing protein n=2 Tax=Octopus bimaculoides TaxID=37653 RepID=A0A0L8GGG4_OCTBM